MSIPTGSKHYKEGFIEPLELIESQKLGFHLGNVVKYAVRANFYHGKVKTAKKELDAIDKAVWYLLRYRDMVTKPVKPQ